MLLCCLFGLEAPNVVVNVPKLSSACEEGNLVNIGEIERDAPNVCLDTPMFIESCRFIHLVEEDDLLTVIL